MESCCHVLTGIPSCYLDMLDKLDKRVFMTVVPSLAASVEPLVHCRDVAVLSLFYSHYVLDVHLNWLQWVSWFQFLSNILHPLF